MNDRVRSLSARGTSVHEDWHSWLTDSKELVFQDYSKHLESNYVMFSVALNEAIGLCREGRLGAAHEAMGLSPGLCRLLTQPLSGLLRALSEHSKHYGTVPNAAPLDPENFRGLKSQRSVRMHALLNRVLLSHRYQFLHKIATLQEIVEDLEKGYCLAASDLTDGASADPFATWASLDADHYDLNTCLREGLVLLKSFLLAIPEDQLRPFQNNIREQSLSRVTDVPVGQTAVRHGRMTSFAGE